MRFRNRGQLWKWWFKSLSRCDGVPLDGHEYTVSNLRNLVEMVNGDIALGKCSLVIEATGHVHCFMESPEA